LAAEITNTTCLGEPVTATVADPEPAAAPATTEATEEPAEETPGPVAPADPEAVAAA